MVQQRFAKAQVLRASWGITSGSSSRVLLCIVPALKLFLKANMHAKACSDQYKIGRKPG